MNGLSRQIVPCWISGCLRQAVLPQTKCKMTGAVLAGISIIMNDAKPHGSTVESARGVLRRLVGQRADSIELQLLPSQGGRDRFTYECRRGRLRIEATSSTALCSGFYQYLKGQGLGMRTWAGRRLEIPKSWPAVPKTAAVSPFKLRQCFNVVTYGYTMPYWSWERWEEELDWMALHGINMPLALVGQEAIATRIWRRLGLTQAEIDEFYTGPAFLPWQRMGNITKHNGPLSDAWHRDQVALQKKILRRMRELGMTPIVPGFSGFVPKGIHRLYPEAALAPVAWGGFPADKQAQFLSHRSPLFSKISEDFIAEWEKVFGPDRHKLVDSFNEMDLPSNGAQREEFLASYGEEVSQILAQSHPENVWVIQGWMFGYQRDIWNEKTVAALFSKVPDSRMLIMDMACDYNGTFWRNGMNWEVFKGFFGKPWTFGWIPNMGGKTGYTGVMPFYADHLFLAVNSQQKGNLAGCGLFMEGLENNEVIYELLADSMWRSSPVNLREWTKSYCLARYGGAPKQVIEGWELLYQSCYGSFTDHPGFGWQTGRPGVGTMTKSPKFAQGVRLIASASPTLKKSPLYQADLIEMTAMVLGSQAEDLFGQAEEAHKAGKADERDSKWAEAQGLLLNADRLLESHPNHRLSRWVGFARAKGRTLAEKNRYEADAKRIVTVWGPPVNDYSRRLWSGLIRSFYVPRMELQLRRMKGEAVSIPDWEERWVMAPGLSSARPFGDPCQEAQRLLDPVTG